MKKHQLIKYAYDNYAKGTKFNALRTSEIKESDGDLMLRKEGGDVMIHSDGHIIYEAGVWATIISQPKQDGETTSILCGKCAIQVNNEREFKLLMEHYDSKGWLSVLGRKSDQVAAEGYPLYCDYHDSHDRSTNIGPFRGYKIIPFADFASEVGIEVPVKIMVSEDGVDLYEGDDYHRAWFNEKWKYDFCTDLKDYHAVNRVDEFAASAKAFSTKEAAEKWCEEQNKPQIITISKDSKYPIELSKSGGRVLCRDTDNHKDNIIFTGQEIEEMYNVYQSLQETKP